MKKKQNIQFLIKLSLSLFITFLFCIKAFSQSNPFLSGQTNTSPYAVEKNTVQIVFDASGSMREEIGGESKIRIAKRVLEKVLLEADMKLNIGLRVYGARGISSDSELNCQDTQLLIHPNTNNRRSIIQAVDQVAPSGLTPITYSLAQAVKDLAPYKGEKSIILISDGLETCNYDPCILASRMQKYNVDIMIDVVGFGLKEDYQALRQLKCVALATHGRFFSANTAAELAQGLADSFNTNVSGRIITSPARQNTNEELKSLPQIQSEKIDIQKVK